MGRPKLKIDTPALLNMRSQGKSIKEISNNFGISTATLSRRIAELRYKEGIISKYRELQHLQLTALQFKILESVTPDKLDRASLLELARAYYILEKAKPRLNDLRPSNISGLMSYLLQIDQDNSL